MTPIDLHVHSRFSDGLLTPQALCALAIRRQVRVLGLCDHDTTDGLADMEMAACSTREHGETLTVLPSVELSTGSDGRTHLLGYGVQADEPTLQAAMAELRHRRAQRGEEMLERLRLLGVDVPRNLLPDPAATGIPIGRPHVARALTILGVTGNMEQAYARYLAEGRPGYIPLAYWTASQAIGLLRAAHAVPVLAHPMRIGLEPQMLESLIESLQASGLQGMEAYHPSASRHAVRALDALARRRGLLVTGGSDFHGDHGAHANLGSLPSGWTRWPEDLQALMDRVASNAREPATAQTAGTVGTAG